MESLSKRKVSRDWCNYQATRGNYYLFAGDPLAPLRGKAKTPEPQCKSKHRSNTTQDGSCLTCLGLRDLCPTSDTETSEENIELQYVCSPTETGPTGSFLHSN